jgi:hypothetical protein
MSWAHLHLRPIHSFYSKAYFTVGPGLKNTFDQIFQLFAPTWACIIEMYFRAQNQSMQSHWVQAPSIHLSVYIYINKYFFLLSFIYSLWTIYYTQIYIYINLVFIYIYTNLVSHRISLQTMSVGLWDHPFLGNPSCFTLNLNPKTLH